MVNTVPEDQICLVFGLLASLSSSPWPRIASHSKPRKGFTWIRSVRVCLPPWVSGLCLGAQLRQGPKALLTLSHSSERLRRISLALMETLNSICQSLPCWEFTTLMSFLTLPWGSHPSQEEFPCFNLEEEGSCVPISFPEAGGGEGMTQWGVLAILQVFSLGVWRNPPKLLQEEPGVNLTKPSQGHLDSRVGSSFSPGGVFPLLVDKNRKQGVGGGRGKSQN